MHRKAWWLGNHGAVKELDTAESINTHNTHTHTFHIIVRDQSLIALLPHIWVLSAYLNAQKRGWRKWGLATVHMDIIMFMSFLGLHSTWTHMGWLKTSVFSGQSWGWNQGVGRAMNSSKGSEGICLFSVFGRSGILNMTDT